MSIIKAPCAALTDDPHPLISKLTFEQGTRKPVHLSLRTAGSGVSVKHGCTWRTQASPSLSPCLSLLNMVPGECGQATLLVAGLNGPLWASCCCVSQHVTHTSLLPHTLGIAFEPGWLKSHHPSLLCVCVVQLLLFLRSPGLEPAQAF